MKRVPWQEAISEPAAIPGVTDLLMFDEGLNRLEQIDARKARVLEAWFFSGMTVEEIAQALEIGETTVYRDLDFSKVWIARELGSLENHGE